MFNVTFINNYPVVKAVAGTCGDGKYAAAVGG